MYDLFNANQRKRSEPSGTVTESTQLPGQDSTLAEKQVVVRNSAKQQLHRADIAVERHRQVRPIKPVGSKYPVGDTRCCEVSAEHNVRLALAQALRAANGANMYCNTADERSDALKAARRALAKSLNRAWKALNTLAPSTVDKTIDAYDRHSGALRVAADTGSVEDFGSRIEALLAELSGVTFGARALKQLRAIDFALDMIATQQAKVFRWIPTSNLAAQSPAKPTNLVAWHALLAEALQSFPGLPEKINRLLGDVKDAANAGNQTRYLTALEEVQDKLASIERTLRADAAFDAAARRAAALDKPENARNMLEQIHAGLSDCLGWLDDDVRHALEVCVESGDGKEYAMRLWAMAALQE